MRVRQGIKAVLAAVLTGSMVTGALVVATATTAGAQTTSSAPGITSNSVTVGTISTQTGILASNFGTLIYGERAYFDYINAQGGVNGRKINYKYALDDGGNATTFNQLANTLINQDHVFAVTGVGTASFSPSLFVESGIPTYGYNVTGNWQGPKNLFAAGGSVEYYPAGAPSVAYVSKKTDSPSIAFVAYGIAASSDACQAEETALQNAGFNISYSDLKINYPGTTVATDVQRMKSAGTKLVVSCMDVQGNVNMARAIQQYGAPIKELWFNGNDQQTLNQNKSLMQGIYFNIAHVPFTSSQSEYPGLKLYITEMKKYEPNYVDDELAIQGWESAALFVDGLKAAGANPTWAGVIAADNSLTSFTANGLTAPINWKIAGHEGHAPPYCSADIEVKGDQYVAALDQGKNVFDCFDSIDPKKATPMSPLPAGTPTPA